MQEVWRDINGFVGLYEVSNQGRVRNTRTLAILTPFINSGYRKVVLSHGALEKTYVKVAKLVATAFVPNPNNYIYVAHKDRDKLNDCDSNLVWCMCNYTGEFEQGKAVLVSNKNRYPLSIHPSLSAAAEAYDCSPTLVSKKCREKHGAPTKSGLYFEYFER